MGLALQCFTTFINVRIELIPRLKCMCCVDSSAKCGCFRSLEVDLGLNRVDVRSGAHRGKTSKEKRNSSAQVQR